MEELQLSPSSLDEANIDSINVGIAFCDVWGFQCDAMTHSISTDEEATEELNSRAERTCRYEFTGRRAADPSAFVPQEMVYECSRCHGEGAETEDGILQLRSVPKWMKYCPNCGARIVK